MIFNYNEKYEGNWVNDKIDENIIFKMEILTFMNFIKDKYMNKDILNRNKEMKINELAMKKKIIIYKMKF